MVLLIFSMSHILNPETLNEDSSHFSITFLLLHLQLVLFLSEWREWKHTVCCWHCPPYLTSRCHQNSLMRRRMVFNHVFNLLLLLVNSSLCTNEGEKEVCSPALVDPSPVQHQWAEDGLEVRVLQAVLDYRQQTFLACLIKISGFYTFLFLLLHTQQSKRRYLLVQGPQVLNSSTYEST